MYTIKLPFQLDGERYGVVFFRGEGKTDSKTLAKKLKSRGIVVERAEGKPPEETAPKKTIKPPKKPSE